MQITIIDYKKRICEAMNFISKNLNRDLSLDEIAAAASFSKFHFHRVFKSVVGETVANFTKRIRLEYAANKLVSSKDSEITTIAIECGFSSSQNFARAFGKHFGITPTEYRNSKIGNRKSKELNTAFETPDYYLSVLNNNLSDSKKELNMKAEVKSLPESRVAYVRKIGRYSPETCAPAFKQLMDWAIPRNLVGPEKVLAIYWDNPEVTPAEKCRFDACIKIPDDVQPAGEIFEQTIKGGNYAVCNFEVTTFDIPKAWEESFKWVVKSGYECYDSPAFELYHNNSAEHPEGKWILDICIPLKEKI